MNKSGFRWNRAGDGMLTHEWWHCVVNPFYRATPEIGMIRHIFSLTQIKPGENVENTSRGEKCPCSIY